MNKQVKRTIAAISAVCLVTIAIMLTGCGSSGGGLSSQVVSGTAAVGAPLSGQVSLKDSSSPSQQKTTVIGSDGSFAIDVTGMKAPYVLQATGSASGADYKLHSFADGTGTANINPLSNVIVASAAEVDDPSFAYENADSERTHKIRDNLSKTVSILLAKLEPLLKIYSAQNTNPITTRYIANHLDLDEMFDNVKITVSQGNLSIVNAKTGAVIFTGKVTDIANGVFTNNVSNLPQAPTVPVVPTGLTAVGGTAQMTLSWNVVSNATSYNLYYATSPGVSTTNGTRIAATTSPYIQSGLAAGTTYYYVVTAVNSAGESPTSAQAFASTSAAPPVLTAPSAPAGVTAAGGTNQVTLSWSAASTATSYNVYYSTTTGVTKANGTKITNATSPAVHGSLSAGTTYYYIVTAINSTGESAASVQVSATTLIPTPVPTAPAAPSGVTAAGGANQVTISWTATSGATSYNLYRSNTSGVTKANGTIFSGVSSPSTQTGLADATAYYYIVTAVNSAGESIASAQVTATTNPAPTPTCGSCHAVPPTSGTHTFHLSKGYTCVICHGAGYSTTTVNATTHINGVRNVVSNLGWNGTTCGTPGCHGSRNW